MKQLKIFIGRWYEPDPVYNFNHTKTAIIIAHSFKEAQEISGLSYSELKNYFSISELGSLGNEIVLKTCTEVGLWIDDNPYHGCTLRRVK